MATVTNHYDLIVLGTDLAGLVAAALVARRGKRVLVVPHGHVDGTYRLGNRAMPLETAPVIHMDTAPVRRVFQDLGLWQQVRREPVPIEGLIHLVLDDVRLDLDASWSNLVPELDREWPDDPAAEALDGRSRAAEAMDERLEEILGGDAARDAEAFWSRRFLARVAEQLPVADLDDLLPLPPDHPLRVASHLIEPWMLHLTPAQLGKAASLRLAAVWGRGPRDLKNGEARMREILMQRIELHSGEIKRDIWIGDLVFRRGKLTGVTLLGKKERYGADHLIVATDPRRLMDGGPLLPDHLPRGVRSTLGALADVARRYVLHLEVEARGLSPALGELALCAPAGATVDELRGNHGVGATFVRVRPGARDDLRLVTITRMVGADEPTDDLRAAILDELDERGVLPFVRDHVVLCHSPHDDRPATGPGGEPLPELASTSSDRLPMSAVMGVAAEPTLGVGILPQSAGLKNLFFASRLGLPGLGLEGEFATGTMAAGLVAAPGRTPFSRSPLLKRV